MLPNTDTRSDDYCISNVNLISKEAVTDENHLRNQTEILNGAFLIVICALSDMPKSCLFKFLMKFMMMDNDDIFSDHDTRI